jgi:hypothetical protein
VPPAGRRSIVDRFERHAAPVLDVRDRCLRRAIEALSGARAGLPAGPAAISSSSVAPAPADGAAAKRRTTWAPGRVRDGLMQRRDVVRRAKPKDSDPDAREPAQRATNSNPVAIRFAERIIHGRAER